MARSIQMRMPPQRHADESPSGHRPGADAPAGGLSWRAALALWAAFALAGWALTGMAMLVMA